MKRKIENIPPTLWTEKTTNLKARKNGKAFGPELEYWENKNAIVIGTDEAGRGPLAGPVVAAAVSFKPDVKIDGIGDSKQLTEKKREKLFDEIIDKAEAYSIIEKSPVRIDEINILQASREAMDDAVKSVSKAVGSDWPIVLVDGRIPRLSIGQHINVIKGDAKSFTIGAASILAKVHRDRLMKKMDKKYPEYGLAKHKGYPTAFHRKQILENGICEIHRKSFTISVNQNGDRMALGEIVNKKKG